MTITNKRQPLVPGKSTIATSGMPMIFSMNASWQMKHTIKQRRLRRLKDQTQRSNKDSPDCYRLPGCDQHHSKRDDHHPKTVNIDRRNGNPPQPDGYCQNNKRNCYCFQNRPGFIAHWLKIKLQIKNFNLKSYASRS